MNYINGGGRNVITRGMMTWRETGSMAGMMRSQPSDIRRISTVKRASEVMCSGPGA